MYKKFGIYKVTSKDFEENGNYIHCYKVDGNDYVHYITLSGIECAMDAQFGDKSPFAEGLELISDSVESFAENHPELLI